MQRPHRRRGHARSRRRRRRRASPGWRSPTARALDADLVVFAAGVRPARRAGPRRPGCAVGERGGVVVDDACRTADPTICAIGECACIDGRVYGLVAPGYAMAEVVADRLLGGDGHLPRRRHCRPSSSCSASTWPASATPSRQRPARSRSSSPTRSAGVYKKLVLSDDAQTLLGGVLVGDAGAVRRAAPDASAAPLPAATRRRCSLPGRRGGGAAGDAARRRRRSAPATTSPPGAIRAAIAERRLHRRAPRVKACTRAGTSCGSCVPLLKQLARRRARGVRRHVTSALCEHFDLTRAAAVRRRPGAAASRTFSRARRRARPRPRLRHLQAGRRLDPRHRSAPAHILDGEQAALQDTNDHFLANLQKDGTYSVVPADPRRRDHPGEADRHRRGGPRLRALHQDHRRPADRPVRRPGRAAARDLAAAGRRRLRVRPRLRQGAAHGEVVRRARPGAATACRTRSAWRSRWSCATAGCASPHKIKLGVSGCARECAEARSKDVGVIATEQRLEPLRRRQRRLHARGTPSCSPRTSTPRRWSAPSTGSSCSTSAPPTGCSAPPPGSRTLEGGLDHLRAVDRRRLARHLRRPRRARWPRHVDGLRGRVGAPRSTTRRGCAGSSRSSTPPTRRTRRSPSSPSAASPARRPPRSAQAAGSSSPAPTLEVRR